MRLWSVLTALTWLLVGCQGTFGEESAHRPQPPGDTPMEIPTPSCPVDPDCAIGGNGVCECPGYWLCDDLASGGKRCTNPGPDFPDDGNWVCEEVGGSTICRGNEFPDNGGDGEWNCERQAEFVVCEDNTPNYPDGFGDGPWNCWFEDEFRICESGGGPGDGGGWSCYDTATGEQCRQDRPDFPDDREWECYDAEGQSVCTTRGGDVPDGGGDGQWNCESMGEFVVCRDDTPDYPDGGGDGEWNCYYADEFRICDEDTPDYPDGGDMECVPGVQRWCDDHIYCSWGKQTCLPDGRWGPCVEPSVTSSGLQDRPATECGCRYFYFNWDCCEDQADRDGDGNPDCIIPETHTPPTCASSGALCSYCDVHGDCGSANDRCVFRRDGYAFCAQDCSSSSCPGGYECQAIGTAAGTIHQCVPTGGSCG